MALNLNPDRVDPRRLQDSLRAIERHLNDDHYVRSIGPGAMVLEGTAAHAVVNFRWGVVSLPADGTSSSCLATFLRPSEWLSGQVAVRFWYSSPTGSTNNFRIFTQIGIAKDTTVMTASTLALNSVRTLAGPAVANTLVEAATVYTSTAVTRDIELISVRVQRTDGHADDTNANAFHLYAVRAEFVPAYQEAT